MIVPNHLMEFAMLLSQLTVCRFLFKVPSLLFKDPNLLLNKALFYTVFKIKYSAYRNINVNISTNVYRLIAPSKLHQNMQAVTMTTSSKFVDFNIFNGLFPLIETVPSN